MKRRDFLKLSAFLGTAAAAGLGLERVGRTTADPPSLSSRWGGQPPEARIDKVTGKVEPNPEILIRNSACLGCFSSCGNRVKIDRKTGKILRVSGNPYNPNNAEPHLLYETPIKESYQAFGQFQDKGLIHRGALCARGNATLETHYDPMRILVPLKRTGKRGDGKWKPLAWEQALEETVEGGKLFAEIGEDRVVEGFRQVYDTETPLDPKQPELGPRSNQLVCIGGRADGRTPFPMRFAAAFGSINYYTHSVT